MTFLIEVNTYDDGNPEEMAKYLTESGVNWSYVKYVPFDGGIQFVKPCKKWHKYYKHYDPHRFEPTDENVVFYGSINALKFIQNTSSNISGIGAHWSPVGWCNFDKLSCLKYFNKYGKYLVGQDYAMMPVHEIYRKKDFIFKTFGKDGKVFIRPVENDKSFNGELICEDKWDEWYRYTDFYDKTPDKIGVIARPVKIHQEWRLVVQNGKVVAGSQYKLDNSVEIVGGYSDESAEFAEKIISESKWTPHPIFVMDIARTENGIGLVEIGSVNTCGLYSCDIPKVVNAMIETAKADFNEVR